MSRSAIEDYRDGLTLARLARQGPSMVYDLYEPADRNSAEVSERLKRLARLGLVEHDGGWMRGLSSVWSLTNRSGAQAATPSSDVATGDNV